ncbi:MAG: hypothetical protein ACYS9X_20245 [Planctomycetota bacterium]|jgi:hypothetical protein
MPGIKDLTDGNGAQLIHYVLARKENKFTEKKGLFGSKLAFEIVPKEYVLNKDWKCYTFYAVKPGSTKSGFGFAGETVLTEIAKKIIDGGLQMAGLGKLSSVLGAMTRANKKTGSQMLDDALKVSGAMQLYSAKKMGKDVYNQVRSLGLTSKVLYGGGARIEVVENCLCVKLRAWKGKGAHRGVTFFDGLPEKMEDGSGVGFKRIDKQNAPIKVDAVYFGGGDWVGL